jgi:hypothetical protein
MTISDASKHAHASASKPWPGRIALMVAHCAGMVDLVALPVSVGTLVSHYKLDPQQAGGLVTMLLVGAVISSLFFASRFARTRGRTAASVGFGWWQPPAAPHCSKSLLA